MATAVLQTRSLDICQFYFSVSKPYIQKDFCQFDQYLSVNASIPQNNGWVQYSRRTSLRVWLKVFFALYNDSVARQPLYVARQWFFCGKRYRIILRHLFSRMKVKVNVFLVLWVFLTACYVAKYCTLHYIDLYGNIF